MPQEIVIPAQGSIVEVDGVLYVVTGGIAYPMFPPPVLTNISPDLWSADQDPDTTAQGRDIQLQALGTNGWYNVAPVTNESDLPQQVNLLGLVTNQVRWNYIIEDCSYVSGNGTFDPPIEPPLPCTIIPARTVDSTADANQQTTLPPGAYLILTNDYGVSNDWSQHVGEIALLGGGYEVLPVGATIYNLQSASYWFLFASGWAPLFPPLLVTQNIDGTVFIESQWPFATAENDRQMIVTATSPGGSPFVLWGGTEQDLPVTVIDVGIQEPASAIYIDDDGCVNTAPSSINELPDVQNVVCEDGIQYGVWTYPEENITPGYGFLFVGSSGLDTLTMTFAGGTMDPVDSVILFYDSEGGTQINQLTGVNTAQGFSITSTTNQLYVLFSIGPGAPLPQPQPFWWQIVCTQGSTALVVFPAVIDDCLEWEFSVDVDVQGTGDGSDITLEYTLDGVAQPPVTGVGIGITTLGPFAIGQEVVITAVDPTNANNSILLGAFTGGATCDPDDDPCLPQQTFKVDGAGDLADRPSNPGVPFTYSYYVTGDATGEGAFPVNSIIVFPPPTGPWAIGEASVPAGSVVNLSGTYYISQGGTLPPLFLFTPGVMWPEGMGTYGFSLDYFDTGLNRAVALEVRDGIGAWTQVWTGFEGAITNNNYVTVTPGQFTQARMLWNWDTCPVYRMVSIVPISPLD